MLPGFTEVLPGPVQTVTHSVAARPLAFGGNKINAADYDWVTLVLLTGFLMLAYVKYNFPKRMAQLIKACFVPRTVSQLFRDGNPFNEQATLLLGMVFFLTSSLTIFVVLNTYGLLPNELADNLYLYAGIFGINVVYWLLKMLANRLLAHIFKTYELTGSYLLNSLLFNLSLGVFLLLALPLVIYTGVGLLLNLTIAASIVLLIYKILRGIQLGLTVTRFPPFYLILYICTLEAAPLLVMAKYFMIQTGL